MDYAEAVQDLDIVADAVWNAVGGDVEMAVEGPAAHGGVQVRKVDRKKYGVEVAGSTPVTFTAANQTAPAVMSLSVIRPFKVMDLIVSVGAAGTAPPDLPLAAFFITDIDISGTKQLTSQQPLCLDIFAIYNFSERPTIKLDTIQTQIPLSMTLSYVGPTIAGDATLTVAVAFAGVALKRA